MTGELRAGTLRFTWHERTFGDDGGLDIRVYGPQKGQERQLLRFDCFRKSPHYHFDPDGRDEHHFMTAEQGADSLGWTLAQFRERLPELITRAGGDAPAVEDAGRAETRETLDQLAEALNRK